MTFELWYATLNKSLLTPAPWVFMWVWPLLYGLMFAAMWLAPWSISRAGLFFVQLLANGLWQWVFFRGQKLGLAFIGVGALWLMNVIILTSLRPHIRAWILYLPYVLWLSFAGYLAGYLWWFNS